jgi:GTPase Era involved in 16S rRNA processing
MSKRSFVIISEAVRERAIEWLRQLPLKSVVRTDDKPTRSGAQNDRFHAMLIARRLERMRVEEAL